MAFGLSFGGKKNKIDKTTSVNSTENTAQQQTGTKAQSGSTATNTARNENTATSNAGTTQGRTSSQTAGTSSGTTTNAQQLFSGDVLSGLEGLATQLIGGTPSVAASPFQFDADSYIKGGVAQAEAAQKMDLEANLSGLTNAIGGTASGNTMNALLANRLRGDAAANIAGVRSSYTESANEIENRNLQTGIAQTGQQQGYLANILSILKGGTSTSVGEQQQVTTEQQAGTQAQATQGTQQSATTGQESSQQTQQLIEALDQLLKGNTTKVGTERVKGTEKKSGGGFSLGF